MLMVTCVWYITQNQDQLSADAKKAYNVKHIDPSSVSDRNGGAHFAFLSNILERNSGGNGFIVGNSLTIADIQVCFGGITHT